MYKKIYTYTDIRS